MNAEQQWQNIKEGYLKQIQKELAKVDHPGRAEILNSVQEHLEQKYAQLPERQRNWEGYQQIITEMGPPEDYAELLTEERRRPKRTDSELTNCWRSFLLSRLIAIGAYLDPNGQKAPTEQPGQATYLFEMDESNYWEHG